MLCPQPLRVLMGMPLPLVLLECRLHATEQGSTPELRLLRSAAAPLCPPGQRHRPCAPQGSGTTPPARTAEASSERSWASVAAAASRSAFRAEIDMRTAGLSSGDAS
jgi:hypothetical protein